MPPAAQASQLQDVAWCVTKAERICSACGALVMRCSIQGFELGSKNAGFKAIFKVVFCLNYMCF